MFAINELREKRANLFQEAKAFLDTHRTENGTLSAEDGATYDRMEAEIIDLGKEITRMENLHSIEADLNRPTAAPLINRPGAAATPATGRASAEYKEAMLTAFRTNFHKISNVLQEGIDASGGYLVPVEYDTRLIDKLTDENIMRALGTVITTSGEHKINIAGNKPAAAWIEEGGALTFGDATFAQIILDAHKLHVAIKVTEELLYDNAFNLENYIIDQFSKALANAEEDGMLNGTGVGQPLGIFAATGGGTVADTVTELTADSLIDLVYALKRPYRKNAAFIINDKNLAVLRKLKDGIGNYILQPSFQAGEPDHLLGYKVYTSAYAPLDAIAFGDFSYYNIGDRGTRSFQELKELFAGNGMVGFVAKERVDGKLVLPEAVQILKISAANG
jgi:HK97 family phage major capsid protein